MSRFCATGIRFQNTGTYPAERVVVRNALPEELNLSSIARIASSHPMVIQREGRQELALRFRWYPTARQHQQ